MKKLFLLSSLMFLFTTGYTQQNTDSTYIQLDKALQNPLAVKVLSVSNPPRRDLKKLNIAAFKNAVSIQLNYAKLKEIPSGIDSLKNLTYLDLCNNKIKHLAPELFNVHTLKTLRLDDNQLKEIPDDIKRLDLLESLLLSRNKKPKLSNEIGNLKNLKEFRLRHTGIKEIPAFVANLKPSITTLCFAKNKIKQIPDFIFTLDKLTYLSFWRNKLTNIPTDVSKLQNMKYLYVSENPITDIPESVKTLEQLKIIGIWDTKIPEDRQQVITSWFKDRPDVKLVFDRSLVR